MSADPPKIRYPNIDLPSARTRVFFGMWSDLAELGQLPPGHQVLCPFCLDKRSEMELTVEHIIPQRALKHDPKRLRDKHSLSNRSGLTLLCKYCNGLKGKFYDPMLEKIFRFPNYSPRRREERDHLKALRTLGYLAAFREKGYSYILSKKLDPVRQDFFNPLQPAAASGSYFLSLAFHRTFPHAYFEGWCDTYDENGVRTNSVFSCHSDTASDTLQIRARHVTVTLPSGDLKAIIVKKSTFATNIHLDLSRI